MKYSFDFVWLGIVVFILASMSATTVYYWYRFDDLSSNYYQQKDRIENVSVELNQTLKAIKDTEGLLAAKEKILSEYIEELNITKEKETHIGEQFTELRGEKGDLEAELTTSLSQLETCAEQLNYTLIKTASCKSDYQSLRSAYIYLNDTTAVMSGTAVEVRSKLMLTLNDFDELEGDVEDFSDSVNDLIHDAEKAFDIDLDDIDCDESGLNESEELLCQIDDLKSDIVKVKNRRTDAERSLEKLEVWVDKLP